MTKTIEQVREIMDGISFSGRENIECNIVSSIVNRNSTDDEIAKYITQKISEKKTATKAIIDYAKKVYSKTNRVEHIFSTLDELNKFKATHNCGNFWDDYTNWHVYEYPKYEKFDYEKESKKEDEFYKNNAHKYV